MSVCSRNELMVLNTTKERVKEILGELHKLNDDFCWYGEIEASTKGFNEEWSFVRWHYVEPVKKDDKFRSRNMLRDELNELGCKRISIETDDM